MRSNFWPYLKKREKHIFGLLLLALLQFVGVPFYFKVKVLWLSKYYYWPFCNL
jgi:hypothetical protein